MIKDTLSVGNDVECELQELPDFDIVSSVFVKLCPRRRETQKGTLRLWSTSVKQPSFYFLFSEVAMGNS